jgi:putative oxidoreductase
MSTHIPTQRARRQTLFASKVDGRAAVVVAVIRILAGAFFMTASIPKFPFAGSLHAYEMAQFVRFGFPPVEAIVILTGVAELVGGALLVIGLVTRVAAAGLAVIMIGAISTAGVRVGGPFHLGVAPTLLAMMVVLLYVGPGAWAIDRRFATHRTS